MTTFTFQVLIKMFSWIKKKLIFLKSKLLIPRPPFKGRPSFRRSLQPTKENIQHFKTWHFLTFLGGNFRPPESRSGFLIRIRIHWPDWIRIQFGSGSGSEPMTTFTFFRSYCWIHGTGYIRPFKTNNKTTNFPVKVMTTSHFFQVVLLDPRDGLHRAV